MDLSADRGGAAARMQGPATMDRAEGAWVPAVRTAWAAIAEGAALVTAWDSEDRWLMVGPEEAESSADLAA
jgi:hypothetical protein